MALKIGILSFSMIVLFSACGGSGDGSGSKTTININSNSTSSSTIDLKKYESRPDMPNSSLKNDINNYSYSQPQQQNESQRPIVQDSYQNSNSANSISEKLHKYYGDNLVSYTYTYAKGGIFVEVRDGDEIELHLLDSHTLVDEKILLSYGYPMREIVGLKGGLVKLVYSNGQEIIFDYFDNHVVNNNSSQEDSDTNHTTSDNISIVKSAVKQYYKEKMNSTVYQFDYVKYLSNSKYLVKSEVSGTMDMYAGLLIVDISNKNHIRIIKLSHENRSAGANSDIVSIDQDNGILEFQNWVSYMHIYIKYNYIDEYEISRREVGDDEEGSSSDNSSSSSSSVQEKLSSQLENLIAYKYSYQGGGIFAIGTKNGEYSFYRFDASSLELERSFYNVGLNRNYSIDGIDALPNGNFKIYTSGGVYTFNYFDGSFY